MKQNVYHKLRQKNWLNIARKGGKKHRWEKGILRSKIKNWSRRQDERDLD